jgi:hypothetical protein
MLWSFRSSLLSSDRCHGGTREPWCRDTMVPMNRIRHQPFNSDRIVVVLDVMAQFVKNSFFGCSGQAERPEFRALRSRARAGGFRNLPRDTECVISTGGRYENEKSRGSCPSPHCGICRERSPRACRGRRQRQCRASGRRSRRASPHGRSPPQPVYIEQPPEMVIIPRSNVYFAPGASVDLFFYDNRWWNRRGDRWYRANAYNGPWTVVGPRYVPAPVYRVPADYRTVYVHEKRIPYGQWKKSHLKHGGKHKGHGNGDRGRHHDD